jgi:hypothetical protein
MILDCDGNPRYADKTYHPHVKPPSPELKRLYREMEANPRFHISRENNFYPRGFPSFSPGWGLG